MSKINKNYLNLENNYLFSKIAYEKQKYLEKHNSPLIDLSIGDVTLPLTKTVSDGIDIANKLLKSKETFVGYPPSSGHSFLKEQIIKHDYNARGVTLSEDEIFISDSSKSDISHILDIFSNNIIVAIQNPVYPVYVDSNIMRGNTILYYSSLDELKQIITTKDVSIVYICSPNNPTGDAISKKELQEIVNIAFENNILIFFDAAYEAFIQDENIPHSIYELDNAKNVAIEFKSYSKTAGFTPIRLSYSVVPNNIVVDNVKINDLYKRLKDTKYNGPSYISEYAIYNLYKLNKLDELKENINYYLNNTTLLFDFFKSKNLIATNNIVNSPYVWINTPHNIKSWDFFYFLLDKCGIVGTPGIGFGKNGENHFRFTGFSTLENTKLAIEKLKEII